MTVSRLKFPSDPRNEGAWGRLIERIRGRQEVHPKGLNHILVSLPFTEIGDFENWLNARPIHLGKAGAGDGLMKFCIYGQDSDLAYAKLRWGGVVWTK